jgi:hypothetical protein
MNDGIGRPIVKQQQQQQIGSGSGVQQNGKCLFLYSLILIFRHITST